MRRVKKTVWGTVFSDARVWGAGWKVTEPASAAFQDIHRPLAFAGCQVVENDDGAGAERRDERRDELGLDAGVEGGAVDGSFDDPGCHQIGAGQTGDEGLGLGLAFSAGRGAEQAVAGRAAAPQSRHVGLYRGFADADLRFIKEHRAVRGSASSA